jgi:hypothetical protein
MWAPAIDFLVLIFGNFGQRLPMGALVSRPPEWRDDIVLSSSISVTDRERKPGKKCTSQKVS